MTISLIPKRRGFTLAELMVAMGITVLLLTLLVSVTGVALDAWRISRNKVRAARQAKAALEQMSRDFESMVVRTGNNLEWFYAESDPNAPGPDSNKSPNAARIIMFTAATDRYNGDIGGTKDEGGDVSTVGYRLFYKDPITNEEETNYDVFALYRKLVNPDETYDELLAQDDLESEFGRYDSEIDESTNFVCENIFELSIVFTVEYTETLNQNERVTKIERIPIIATSGAGSAGEFRIFGTGIEVDGADDEDYARGRVVSVDISVTVLTDNGIATLRRAEFSATALEKFLVKNSYSYSKTILLPQP
jgi:prepilin-type N-terminal cleavage/methylation domain-containing protein